MEYIIENWAVILPMVLIGIELLMRIVPTDKNWSIIHMILRLADKALSNKSKAVDKDGGYNYRAEIRTAPWRIKHPPGTEEWFGWSFTLGDDYKIDQMNNWLFFQVHNAVSNASPQISLSISDSKSSGSGDVAGIILVINNANNRDKTDTGITPVAGQTLNFVVHVIWADANTGLLQVWIDDVIVCNKQVKTIYPDYPWAGNAKWGIYHHRWRDGDNVQESLDQGITHVETFLGSLRVITRYPGDPDYGYDSYDLVKPR